MRSHNKLIGVLATIGVLLPWSGWAQEDVSALARLWQQHVRAPSDHAAIVHSAQQMAAQYPNSTLLGVARGLAAWHALASAQTNTAILLLTPLLTEQTDPVSIEARNIAQHWLTRMDRERVRTALQNYYRDHVEFPSSLSALNKLAITNRPPLADRFGQAWKYELKSLKRLIMARAQDYRLLSYTLGDDSDLAAVLRRPYGGGLVLWKPVRFIPAANADTTSTVTFEKDGAKIILTEGARQAGVTLVYAREGMIIITDGDYWQLFAR